MVDGEKLQESETVSLKERMDFELLGVFVFDLL